MFNGHLIACYPKSPAHSGEADPNYTTRTARQALSKRNELPSPCWVPCAGQEFPDSCPHKSSDGAAKEDVVGGLVLSAQGAKAKGRPLPLGNVIT